jgi:two-component system, response regulator PdtaR
MSLIKVLVVEDQLIIARDIEALLTDWGYHVIGCAASSDEALALFDKQKPDLALVDIHIQGDMDGIEVVKEFNARRPIPIVYLTAQADSGTVARAKSSNPFAYLLKPFDERHLQISLELAFDIFVKRQSPSPKTDISTVTPSPNDIKLSSDIILQNNDSIFIKQNYRFVKLKKDELVLIEADRNHSFLYTKQHRYIVRMPLTTVVERLQNDTLVRVHRSFAVNIKYVEEFTDSEITVNGKSIPFTAAYREDFLKNFNVI